MISFAGGPPPVSTLAYAPGVEFGPAWLNVLAKAGCDAASPSNDFGDNLA